MPATANDYLDTATDDGADALGPVESDPDEGSTLGVEGGWGAASKVTKSSKFAEDFKLSEEAQLIKFLTDEPFAAYRQHWIERTGKKSFVCLGEDCPLCEDLGDRPATRIAFNVAVVDGNGTAEVKAWTVGVRVAKQIQNFHSDTKTGPLTKGYWAVSRTGKGQQSSTTITPVKERDLAEDWGVKALTATVLEELEPYDASVIRVSSRTDLEEIVEEQLG